MQKLLYSLLTSVLCSSLLHASAVPVKIVPCTGDPKEKASCEKMKSYADQKSKEEKKEADKKASQPKVKRSVEITNSINTKKLDYSKAFFTYTPTTFTIEANGKLIKPQEKQSIDVTGEKLVIKYYCEFKDGARKSCHEYTYKLSPKTTSCSIAFDWHKEPRIDLSTANAELLSDIKIDCDAPSTAKGSK